ncbi:sensor histidine kinase [Nonomuraea sp. MG754425]|uniref:sensor histidine kinase n=1 Tax=Nonomuraea sp. MG754425 TaxID=2570319 RepID=UPI001F00C4E3|nr:histidine kinase [Nonomuraea sp. MG754425]MCF6469230.1 sensor histidine kinase [Nonomuraea sp. MG754425]
MQGLLRSLWDEPRPPGAPRRVWRDWVLVGLLAVAVTLEALLRTDLQWRPLSVIFTFAMLPTLLWRRTRPLLMPAIPIAVTGLIQLLTGADPAELGATAYLLILLYALSRWGSGREAAGGLALITAAILGSVLAGRLAIPGDVLGAYTVVFAAIALGGTFRYRTRARMREIDQIKLLEREQLARDLHDTVAHHVSAMAIRAQAGIATAGSDPGAAVDALRVIEAEASRTLAEMRAMVRVLRRDRGPVPVELAPNPHLADLEQLAGQARVGPAVHVRIDGDLDGVSASVGAAVFRIAQESVTNARRHARHASRIEVHVAAGDTSVRLRVSDDGDSTAGRPVASPGYGLLGMIERADLLGGTCEAGPNPGRGWTVTAELPRTGAAT